MNNVMDDLQGKQVQKLKQKRAKLALKNKILVCCFVLILICVLIFVIILIIFILSFRPFGGKRRDIETGTTVLSTKQLSNNYFDDSMIDNKVDPCKKNKYHSYICGKNSKFDKDSENTIKFLMSRLNTTIQVGDYTTKPPLYSEYYFNMNKFYKSCMNFKKFEDISSVKVCRKKTVKSLLRSISGARTLKNLIELMLMMMDCNLKLPIQFEIVDSPLYLDLNGEKVVYFYKEHGFPSEIGKNFVQKVFTNYFPLIKFDTDRLRELENSIHPKDVFVKLSDSQCLKYGVVSSKIFGDSSSPSNLKSDILKLLVRKRRGINNKEPRRRTDYICFWSIRYTISVLRHFSNSKNLQLWKNYLKYYVVMNVLETIHIHKVNNERFCLDQVLDHFPISYCKSIQSRIYKFDEYYISSSKVFEDVFKFAKKEITFNYRNYGLNCFERDRIHFTDIIREFSDLKIYNGRCILTYSDRKSFNSEMSSFMEPDKFIENTFKLYSRRWRLNGGGSDFHTSGMFRYLTKRAMYFDENKHTIVVPIGEIVEPYYSTFYNDIGKFGTLGYAISHEIFHSILMLLRRHRRFDCIRDMWKDNFGVLEISANKVFDEKLSDLFGLELVIRLFKHKEEEDKRVKKVNYEDVFKTVFQYLCNKIKWEFKTDSPDGHQYYSFRVNSLIENMKYQSLETFRNVYNC